MTDMFRCTGACGSCGRCTSGIIRDTDHRKTGLIRLPDDFMPPQGGQGYAAAFDIGTTTIAGMLWDLRGARILASSAGLNPQCEYGPDVISRIAFGNEGEKNRRRLHDAVIKCVNDMIYEMCAECGADRRDIRRVSVCGNTAMSHFFAGSDPGSLAFAPFAPAYTGKVEWKGNEAGLDINDDGRVVLLPNIAGHVGGDVTAGILASRLLSKKSLTLLLDMGTNGEVVLAGGGIAAACSTAAGPAFEGGHIHHGMRAAPGAIEKVKIQDGDVFFRTVGDVPPEGICGSGLVDAVAEMLDAGLIDRHGRLADAEDSGSVRGGSDLKQRLRCRNGVREFVLVYRSGREDIVVTQTDIREMQLAKGAIAAGISILLDHFRASEEDLDEVVIAGAFGSFIDSQNAVKAGLIPGVPADRIIWGGNAAGAGALMTAADEKELDRAVKIPEAVTHIELAEDESFQREFMDAMEFKNAVDNM